MTFTIREAARLSGVPAGTLRRWLSEGRLTRVGERKPFRVDLREVEQVATRLGRGA